jgi:hypothetical protein
MNETFSQVLECPDPAQLELFDCPAKDSDPVHSEVLPGTTAIIHLQTRDPTFHEKGENLTQSQKLMADALYRKSRALASKPRPIIDEEE